jgi:hypothetical protein
MKRESRDQAEWSSLSRQESERGSRIAFPQALKFPRAGSALRFLLSSALATSAVVSAGSLILRGLDPADVGRLETPFALSVAMQLERGAQALYGPFDERNHLVMIHAPLYYRFAALLGGFINCCGVERVTASLAAGRLISLLATGLLIATAASTARLDRRAPGAGVLTALLVAAAPIPGILAVMVRPDSLAVALETLGAFWVCKAMSREHETRPASRLAAAYVAFALAFCCKQHNLIVPAVSAALLIESAMQRKSGFEALLIAHLAGLVVTSLYLGVEELATHGEMSRCVFVLPRGPFRTINLGSWTHVGATFAVIAKKMIGYIILGEACAWCVRPKRGGRLDWWLIVYLATELGALAPLFYYNRGAADNYALQAVVFASVLLGRCLARLFGDPEARTGSLIAVAVASMILAAREVQFSHLAWRAREANRAALQGMRESPLFGSWRPEEIYFVDRPEYNRLYGNRRLIHDESVYGAFEAAGAAAPRSTWLKTAIEHRPVHVVVVPDARFLVEGVPGSLPDMGYHPVAHFGHYRVWERPS